VLRDLPGGATRSWPSPLPSPADGGGQTIFWVSCFSYEAEIARLVRRQARHPRLQELDGVAVGEQAAEGGHAAVGHALVEA
jgi:hypothetical protein